MTEKQWNNKEVRARLLLREHRRAEKELAGKAGPKSPFLLEIGRQLKAKRFAAKLTIMQLSAKSGVAFSNIQKIENGETDARLETIKKIAGAMGCILTLDITRKYQSGI